MACKRCGLCCMVCDIRWEEITETNKAAVLDRLRWLSLHRLDTQIVTRKDGKKFSAIRIPLTCVNLDQEKGTKFFKCKDYENRPQVCKDFKCELAKKEDSEAA